MTADEGPQKNPKPSVFLSKPSDSCSILSVFNSDPSVFNSKSSVVVSEKPVTDTDISKINYKKSTFCFKVLTQNIKL
jgi:hypothetical protein